MIVHSNVKGNSDKRLSVSMVFAQMSSVGNVLYILAADYKSRTLCFLTASFFFLPALILAMCQCRWVARHLRAIHVKTVNNMPLKSVLLSALKRLNSVRMKHFSFRQYEEFYHVVILIAGMLLFLPLYLLALALLSPIWVLAVALYTLHIACYLLLLVMFTNGKLLGVDKAAMLFFNYGESARVFSELEDGANMQFDDSVQTSDNVARKLYIYGVLVPLFCESIPIMVIATVNEVQVGNSIVYCIQVATMSLLFLNELVRVLKLLMATSRQEKMTALSECWNKFLSVFNSIKVPMRFRRQGNGVTRDVELSEIEREEWMSLMESKLESKFDSKIGRLEEENVMMKEKFKKVEEENQKYKHKIKRVEEKMSLLNTDIDSDEVGEGEIREGEEPNGPSGSHSTYNPDEVSHETSDGDDSDTHSY